VFRTQCYQNFCKVEQRSHFWDGIYLKFYFCEVKIHEKYISRCIQIAKNGEGSSYPNPSVGSVLVHNETIIGEGYTSPYGGSHAEVNAITSVKNKSLLKSATLYVTLEPCSHFGKTPPCSDFIIKHGIPKVVIGLKDPHVKVAGKGIQKLKNAGVTVITDILSDACRTHHKRFLTVQEKKRPYIILKWAETKDGFLAPKKALRNKEPQPYWITNAMSRQMVHQWRSQEQAIMVGTNTALEDNPKLSVRHWYGRSPIRIVIDQHLKIPKTHHLFDTSANTIVLTAQAKVTSPATHISYEGIDFSKNVPSQVCEIALRYNIISILVEGGAMLLESFLRTNTWDESRVFMGNTYFKEGLKSPIPKGVIKCTKRVGTDKLNYYFND